MRQSLRTIPGPHPPGCPIVCREDEAAFGRYRTRDLVLAYMNALDAGDTDAIVAL